MIWPPFFAWLMRRVSDEDLERVHRRADRLQVLLISGAVAVAVVSFAYVHGWPRKAVAVAVLLVAVAGLAANTICFVCRNAEWHRGWDVPMERPRT